jgi:hypothetical protein
LNGTDRAGTFHVSFRRRFTEPVPNYIPSASYAASPNRISNTDRVDMKGGGAESTGDHSTFP